MFDRIPLKGNGSPEGVYFAEAGRHYQRLDGVKQLEFLYVKTSNSSVSTGWSPVRIKKDEATPGTPITAAVTGGQAGTISSYVHSLFYANGDILEMQSSYLWTPSAGSAFSAHTITPASGWSLCIHGVTGLINSSALPIAHAVIDASTIYANSNNAACTVRVRYSLIKN